MAKSLASHYNAAVATRRITLAHSPDGDDAFMFWALRTGKISNPAYEIVHELGDIEALNRAAAEGRYEITALSAHAYAHVHRHYRVLSTGASVGDSYGPVVVSKRPLTPSDLEECTVAVPGEWTTAALAMRLYQPRARHKTMKFDEIMPAVERGDVDAGVLIHEGQITYGSKRLAKVADLGEWWTLGTGLPLTLGLLAVKRSLDPKTQSDLAHLMKQSTQYGLEHRTEALPHAREFTRGLSLTDTDRFVRMYVNTHTVEMSDRAQQGLAELYRLAHERGLLPFGIPPLDILD